MSHCAKPYQIHSCMQFGEQTPLRLDCDLILILLGLADMEKSKWLSVQLSRKILATVALLVQGFFLLLQCNADIFFLTQRVIQTLNYYP